LANDMPLKMCGDLGALLAGNVIGFLGAKMPEERWVEIRRKLTSWEHFS